MSGTLILVAVITCIITPIIFKKLLPKENTMERKIKGSIGGGKPTYDVGYKGIKIVSILATLYHNILDKADNQIADSLFDVKEIKNYEVDTLENEGIFTSDIMVIMTGNEEVNAELATTAKGRGVERVIARIKES
jgi:monovalent cation:H+ antiporter-2, CPA2 family